MKVNNTTFSLFQEKGCLVIDMDSDKAIWLCEVLEESENVKLNWRVVKKYSEDYDKKGAD